jgi:hypothetical protein
MTEEGEREMKRRNDRRRREKEMKRQRLGRTERMKDG